MTQKNKIIAWRLIGEKMVIEECAVGWVKNFETDVWTLATPRFVVFGYVDS